MSSPWSDCNWLWQSPRGTHPSFHICIQNDSSQGEKPHSHFFEAHEIYFWVNIYRIVLWTVDIRVIVPIKSTEGQKNILSIHVASTVEQCKRICSGYLVLLPFSEAEENELTRIQDHTFFKPMNIYILPFHC